MGKLIRRIHYLLNRDRFEQELIDEMSVHREMMPPDRRGAFGNTLRLHDEARDAWAWLWIDPLLQDLRYSVRSLIRERRFTLSALMAISIAVGAASAVFSVVDRSLFRPLPYYQGNHLISVGLVIPPLGADEFMFWGAYRDWKTTQSAVSLTSWSGVAACDLGGDSPERLNCARVESTFLPTLGVQPALGRVFTMEEDQRGAEPVGMLSYAMWRTNFGANTAVVGQNIVLDGSPTRIVGVLPSNFETPNLAPADILVPQRLPVGPNTQNYQVEVIGRLNSNNTAASAAVALAEPFQRFRSDFGKRVGSNFEKAMELHIERLRDRQVRQYRLALWMLLGAVAAFVLIACANVTNLLLARSSARRQEFAIRVALGISRHRLVCQLLTESGLLGLLGGSAGCGLAWGLLRTLVALAPDGTLRLRQASLDFRVLGLSLILSLATAFIFGLAPSFDALRMVTVDHTHLGGLRRAWLRQALITSQLSVSLVLLAAAGLMLVSLWNLQNVPLGFAREHIVTASFTLPVYHYADDARQINFFTQLEARLQNLPGALATAITDCMPPGADVRTVPYAALANARGALTAPGMPGSVKWRYVTPGYFDALGIPIKRGHGFTGSDLQPGVRNVIVNESLARRFFGDREPIGNRLGASTVVGVVGDARNAGLERPADPEFYQVRKASRQGIPGSADPAWPRRATAIVRSTLNDRDSSRLLRDTLHALDPTVPIQIETIDQQVNHFLVRPRFQTTLLAAFACTGLALAGIGLYGLISFLVAERTREIGVRMALGATPGDVTKFVVSDGARWTVTGLVVGLGLSALLLRTLEGLLFEVRVSDLRVFLGAALLLITVALLAAWLPARRASRLDPLIALRHD